MDHNPYKSPESAVAAVKPSLPPVRRYRGAETVNTGILVVGGLNFLWAGMTMHLPTESASALLGWVLGGAFVGFMVFTPWMLGLKMARHPSAVNVRRSAVANAISAVLMGGLIWREVISSEALGLIPMLIISSMEAVALFNLFCSFREYRSQGIISAFRND